MGAGDFLIHGPLRRASLRNLFRRPSPGGQSLLLGGRRTSHADDFLEMSFRLRLKQERDDDHGQRAIFLPPQFHPGQPSGADARMQNSFKFFPGGRISKNTAAEFGAVQFTGGSENAGPEFLPDFGQGGLAGLDQLARQFIRINDAHAPRQKETGGGGFAHPHAAGQTAKFHALNFYGAT